LNDDADITAQSPPDPAPVKRRRRPWGLAAAAVLLLTLALVVAGVRYGALLPQVRLLIEARTDGLKIGRLGRLRIEGLDGDVWRDLRIRKLTIRDEDGVWLEANDVQVTWRYTELLRRRLDADLVAARSVRVLRRPALGPKGKDRGLPVSFRIDAIRSRLILEPAFSFERGVYDVRGDLDIARIGARRGSLEADSVLRPGDRLAATFSMGGRAPLRIVADAKEVGGGAIAGALGLPVDRAFALSVRADGQISNGRFSASAISGDTTPLSAQGAWTPAGGDASGRLDLSASALTRPLADRIGSTLVLTANGRKAGEGAFALDVRAEAEALAARISGLGDVGARRTGPAGLRLTVRAADLSRVLGGTDAGAATLSGVLRGADRNWNFSGDLGANALGAGNYRVDRVSGPLRLSVRQGVLAAETRLTGVGGRGQGFVAALLGGAPTLSLQVERLANGQLVLRDLNAVGRGLRVEASGRRGLIGGTRLSGRATISNLAAARPGASGGGSATWQAAQASPGAPWTVSLDGEGEGLALGLAELDRLLGPAPRIDVAARWDDGRLAVTRGVVAGRALDGSLRGEMRPGGVLAFEVDWNAQGPFRAGPVEVTGRLSGEGEVTGTVTAPRLDLEASIEQADIPRIPLRDGRLTLSFQKQAEGAMGAVALVAQSAYGPARAQGDFRFQPGGVDLSDVLIDAGGLKAQGAVALRRRTPSSADLSLTVGKGAFLEAGSLSGSLAVEDVAGGPQASLTLRGRNVQLPGVHFAVRAASLTADGPIARLPYALDLRGASLRGPWNIQGQGLLMESGQDRRLTFSGQGRWAGQTLRTTEDAEVRFGEAGRRASVRLVAEDGGILQFDGAFDGRRTNLTARVDRLGLPLFDPDLTGRMNATLRLSGEGADLSGDLQGRVVNARGRGSPARLGLDGSVQARLMDDRLVLRLETSNESGLKGDADFTLPIESSASPFRIAVARQRPFSGRFAAAGEVGPLWDLMIGGDRALAGVVDAQGAFGGTLAAPRAKGSVAVTNGRFDDGATGLALREVSVRAAFDQEDVDVAEVRGVDGHGGRINGQGRVSLARDGASTFRLDLQRFRLIENEQANATATGQATIARGADGKVRLSGELLVDEAEVAADPPAPSGVTPMDVKEINLPDDLQSMTLAQARRGEGWALDVRLRAPRRIFLRGRGLDLEMSLDARVGGTTTEPDLSGVARVIRGDYDFASRRFIFDDRGVVYLSTRPQNIRLQLDATQEDPALTVTVRIRGTAARPEITLVSSPSLPNDEILAQVLFGRSASQLSAVEAAQLAAALSSLAGGGGFDIVGNLRSFAGLDRLAFGGGDEAGVTVSGGKYLTEDVYLELTGGGREGPSAQVEWRIRKNLSILSRIAGQAGNRIAIRWRRDY
jgi:translocation and assembly module TamB